MLVPTGGFEYITCYLKKITYNKLPKKKKKKKKNKLPKKLDSK